MRGVGLIHSPLLQKQGYVSQQMLHVCDWLPTLVKAAGGDPSTLTNLDGYDSWDMLSQNGRAVRNEMLHNIDPQDDSSAIRVGDYKLLMGNLGSNWDGWYPPYQLDGDHQLLHYTNFSTLAPESPAKAELRKDLLQSYRKFWPHSAKSRMKELHSYWATSDVYSKFSRSNADKSENLNRPDFSLNFLSEKQNSDSTLGDGDGPVTINCGTKPANASTNCRPEIAPCLYHIPSDPCEYNNLAYSMPEVVSDFF